LLYWVSCRLLGFSFRRELALLRRLPRAVAYLFLLVWNVLLSNLQVMSVILSPKAGRVKPRLVWFSSPVKSGLGQVILANSITLTPGTFTAGLADGQFCVHALDESFAGGMEDSDFVRAIRGMEGE
jgi:multicomponent Na+:H+ antiporter subunit E